jgi:hypothetical protein
MKPHKQYSDNELRKVALLILTQHLGHANTLRFLSLNQASEIDYMTIRQELFEGLSAKEVYNNAVEFWQNKKNAEVTK